MSGYTLIFTRSARKDLELLSKTINLRILKKIEALEAVPRPPGCIKLSGSEKRWRIRIGDYRVVYDIYDNEKRVDIVFVRHRREVYRVLH